MSHKHKPHDAETHESATAKMNQEGTQHDAHGSGAPETISTDPAAEHTTFQGEPNGLPPAAPEVQLEAAPEVKAHREWFHKHVKNSVHSQDVDHYNNLYRMSEALCAAMQAKHPVEKET